MWKKCVYRQRKTDFQEMPGSVAGEKSAGQVDIIFGMFAFFIVLVILLFSFKICQFMIAGAYVEDALAASNLASALIDVEEYGRTRTIKISNPQNAYSIYMGALATNLQLDEDGRVFGEGLLVDTVDVLEYMVFSVENGQVNVYALQANQKVEPVQTGTLGQVYTPDGLLVETTTVYSKVGFWVEGFMQQRIYAEKEKSVDIKRYEDD